MRIGYGFVLAFKTRFKLQMTHGCGMRLSNKAFQEIATAYNAAIIDLDTVIYDSIVSGTLEAGLKAREFCNNAKLAAAEEDAAAQSAIDGKGGRAAKGGGRRMCKSL